jgi:ABC-type lipoprotein export system ATPase subunit
LIRLEDVEFAYGEGDFRLRVPEFTIEQGASAAVIGPSGSGKTTLLNLIAGIALPAGGRIETAGRKVSTLSDAARRDFRVRHVGLVFQEFELLEYLDVLDNILLPYRINPLLQFDRDVNERARRLAEQVGIGDKLSRYPDRLSQGERQRVGVCRAVLPGPAVLLADEPTGNLDPDSAGRVLDILLEYAAKNGATLLMVTHDHALLPRFQRFVDMKEFQRGAP